MTSKTFKNRVSVRDAESVLEITDTPAGIRLTVREEYGIVHGWFAPKQGAEIALAILEAAGCTSEDLQGDDSDRHFSLAVHHLLRGLEEQERITAEARDRAELEAEAFNLYRTYIAVQGLMKAIGDWHMLSERTKEEWLAVARRAREMRAEK